MKRIITIALLLTACAFIISLVYKPLNPISESGGEATGAVAQVAGVTIDLLVGDTPEEREKGLSGHPGLEPEEGMLFVFPEDGVYSFWMKDMLFAIDIIWLSYSGDIIDIRENAAPESYPTAFTPRGPARYVLELPQGFVAEHRVAVGDVVELHLP